METRHPRTAGLTPAGWLAAVLLTLSLALGGGGTPAPLLELVLQLAAMLIAMAWLWSAPQPWQAIPAGAWWLTALIVVLPLSQLLPLPPGLWQALPGREGMHAALDLVGAGDSWRAMSMSPSRTLASLLVALFAVLSMLFAAGLNARGRWLLLGVVAAAGLATLLLGAAQLSGGSGSWLRFFDRDEIYLTGFQANHNSTADVLLIAMLALAALGRRALDRGLIRWDGIRLGCAAIGVDAVMVLGLFLTGSRAGLLLLPLVLMFQYLILQPDRKVHWLRLISSAAGTAIVGGIAFALLRGNRAIALIVDRFTFEGEFRPELWRDSIYALGQTWPVGSGQGTFVSVMLAAERLEVVDQTLPNRAHNDYLELAIEAGLPGMLVLAVVAVIVVRAMLRARREPPVGSRAQVLFASGTLAVIALHSLVDYPLRSMALAAVAATAVGLLLPPLSSQQAELRGSQP
jgi:exopolysaccharide production protein ExoQ